jgi:hypothetical protein
MEKEHNKMLEISYRPNNFDCLATEQTLENYNLLHQITYLTQQVQESDGIHKFMIEQQQKQSGQTKRDS